MSDKNYDIVMTPLPHGIEQGEHVYLFGRLKVVTRTTEHVLVVRPAPWYWRLLARLGPQRLYTRTPRALA